MIKMRRLGSCRGDDAKFRGSRSRPWPACSVRPRDTDCLSQPDSCCANSARVAGASPAMIRRQASASMRCCDLLWPREAVIPAIRPIFAWAACPKSLCDGPLVPCTHVRNFACKLLQVRVKSACGVFDHEHLTLRRDSSVPAVATGRARAPRRPGAPRAGQGSGASLPAERGSFGPLDAPSP